MIYITCGTCGTSQGYKTYADGALSLPASEEARLVSRGVAEYVTRPVIEEASVATPASPPGGPVPPNVPVNIPGNDPDDEPDIEEGPDIEGEPEEEGDDEAAQLERMTKPELEQMAKDLGLDTSAAKTKSALITLITSADAPEQDNSEDVQ